MKKIRARINKKIVCDGCIRIWTNVRATRCKITLGQPATRHHPHEKFITRVAQKSPLCPPYHTVLIKPVTKLFLYCFSLVLYFCTSDLYFYVNSMPTIVLYTQLLQVVVRKCPDSIT